eukprot:501677_1
MSTSEFTEESQTEESTTQNATISRNPSDDHRYNSLIESEQSQPDSDNVHYRRSTKRRLKLNGHFITECDNIPPKKRIKLDNIKYTKTLEQDNIKLAFKHMETCIDCKKMNLNECGLCSYKPDHPKTYDKDDWKLKPELLKYAVETISNNLNMQGILWPHIDCFASQQNYQWFKGSSFKWFITKEDDFFSEQYDCPSFWAEINAWNNASFKEKTLMRVLEKYKARGIRGYLCGPFYVEQGQKNWNKWYYNAKKECVCEHYIETYDDPDAYYPSRTGSEYAVGPCPFDTVILFFDYRSKERKKYEKGDVIWAMSEGIQEAAIIVSCEYEYPSQYELLWLRNKDESQKDNRCVTMESYKKIESYVNVKEMEELCAHDQIGEVGKKEIKQYRPELYDKYFVTNHNICQINAKKSL